MGSIQLKDVRKAFGAVSVINGINLNINDGEFAVFVGPSGCGKSTALRMVAGLEDISDGELKIDNEVVNDLAPRERDIAMVFQNYALYPHLTVRQNLAFPLSLAKAPKSEIETKVAEAARILELEPHLDRKPANLSGGQRQRVAMGRAIVRSPKAFLMDEPLSNLDAKLRIQMRTEISRLQKRLHVTTVYVTHDQTEAMTLGDRVAVLRGGVLQQYGPPQTLYDYPDNLFVAGFIGSPAMNFVEAELSENRLHTPFGDVTLPDEERRAVEQQNGGARNLIMGIRPENFEDASLISESQRGRGITFTTPIDVVESMGSDVYAHFTLKSGQAQSRELAELAEDSGSADTLAGGTSVVARLSAETKIKEEEQATLWFETSKLHLFDAQTGLNVLGKARHPGEQEAPSTPSAPAEAG
ncbi:MAG: sn-glycerol-3-phosphate ABC transporter ATP-binding protein UgpC [Acidimicrobiaceae bacterium]|nr:sn-glycerol-3-phosphate ABC transporter ATP-binding protein UgpC [Acidimicrobiaceae bacterium]